MISLSFSKWDTYCQCKRKYWYMYVDANRPRWDGDKASGPQAQAGFDVHKGLEGFLMGEVMPIDITPRFQTDLNQLVLKGAIPERDVMFDLAFQQTDRFTEAAFRVKTDAHYVDGRRGTVVDFKTGKIKKTGYMAQAELYALSMFLLYDVDVVTVEFWYLAHDHITRVQFSQWQVPALKERWGKHYDELEKCNDKQKELFDLTPSKLCDYCNFYVGNGGPCNGLS